MLFEEIYELYFKDIYLFLCSLTKDESLAEELVQEAFFKALKAIDRFDGSQDIRAWLFTIARNTYYSYCRAHMGDSYQSIHRTFYQEKHIPFL